MGSFRGRRLVILIAVYAAIVAVVYFLHNRLECAANKRGFLTFRQTQHYAAFARLSAGRFGCVRHFGIGRELSGESFQFRADWSGECFAAAASGIAHHPDGVDDSRLSEDSASVGGPPKAEDDKRRQLSFDIFDRTGLRCRLDTMYRPDFFIDPAAWECDGVTTPALSADVRAWLFGAIPLGNFFHRQAQVPIEVQRSVHENRWLADDPVRSVVADGQA